MRCICPHQALGILNRPGRIQPLRPAALVLVIQLLCLHEGGFKGAPAHIRPGLSTHLARQGAVLDQGLKRLQQGGNVVTCDHQAGPGGDDVLAWAALVGDDDRQPAGLRLQNHVAEGIGGTGKNEDVTAGIDGGQGLAAQVAGKGARQVAHGRLHFRQAGAVTGDQQGIAAGDIQSAVVVGSSQQAFLPRVRVEGRQMVSVGQRLHALGRQTGRHLSQDPVFAVVARSIEFQVVEEQQDLFDMGQGQPIVNGIQGMGDDIIDLLLLQISGEIEYVFFVGYLLGFYSNLIIVAESGRFGG